MLISYFQNSIQGGHLIKNTQWGCLHWHIQHKSAIVWACPEPRNDMAKPCLRTLIRGGNPSPLLRIPFLLVQQSQNLISPASCLHQSFWNWVFTAPPHLVQQCGSFHFVNMACMYENINSNQVFFFSFFSIISFSEFPFNTFLQNKDWYLDVGQKEIPRPDI